jgi:hypothetical protein
MEELFQPFYSYHVSGSATAVTCSLSPGRRAEQDQRAKSRQLRATYVNEHRLWARLHGSSIARRSARKG